MINNILIGHRTLNPQVVRSNRTGGAGAPPCFAPGSFGSLLLRGYVAAGIAHADLYGSALLALPGEYHQPRAGYEDCSPQPQDKSPAARPFCRGPEEDH